LAQGLNPQLSNPGDPWQRLMNYPLLWLDIARALHWEDERCYLASVGVALLSFLGCCALILRRAPSPWTLAIAFSSASLLAVERGNNDTIMFTLAYVAAMSPAGLGVAALLIATALKLYPVLALPGWLLGWRVRRPGSIVALTGVALVAWQLWPEWPAIQAGTPTAPTMSYGAASISATLATVGRAIPAHWISGALLGLTALWCLSPGRLRPQFQNEPDATTERLFLMGAGVYVGSFLLSSNWDYRLIFLLFCLPHLSHLRLSAWRHVISLGMLVAMNQIPLTRWLGKPGGGLNLAAKSALFLALSTLLVDIARQRLRAKRTARVTESATPPTAQTATDRDIPHPDAA
jgi:hypothetical protein